MKKKRSARAVLPKPRPELVPTLEPRPVPRPSTQILMVSRTFQLGKLTFPGWPRSAIALSAVCTAVLLDGLMRDSESSGGDGAFLMVSCVVVLFSLLIFYVLSIRWNRSGRTAIYKDRIEQTLNGELVRSLPWRKVVRQDADRADVWLFFEHAKIGGSSIALDTAEGTGRSTVQFSTTLHPVPGLLRPYENQGALCRAFLLSLVRARPDLRIDADVYTVCEVHPATLAHDMRRKWFGRISVALGIAATAVMLAWWVRLCVDFEAATLLITLGIVVMVIIAFVGTVLLVRLEQRLFPDPEDPGVRKRRLAVLADRP